MADARALTWSPDLSDALGRMQIQMHRLAHELYPGVRSESAIAASRVKPFVRVEAPSSGDGLAVENTWPYLAICTTVIARQINASGAPSRSCLTGILQGSVVLRRSLAVRSGCMMPGSAEATKEFRNASREHSEPAESGNTSARSARSA